MPREKPPESPYEYGVKRHFISRFRNYSGYAIVLLRTLEEDDAHKNQEFYKDCLRTLEEIAGKYFDTKGNLADISLVPALQDALAQCHANYIGKRDLCQEGSILEKELLFDYIKLVALNIEQILREETIYHETSFYANLQNMSLLEYVRKMQLAEHSTEDLQQISSTLSDIVRLYEQEKAEFLQQQSAQNISYSSSMSYSLPETDFLTEEHLENIPQNPQTYTFDVERVMTEITQKVIQEMGNHHINATKQNNRHVSNMLRQQQKKFDAILATMQTSAETFASANSDLRAYVMSLKADIYAQQNMLSGMHFEDIFRKEEMQEDLMMFVEALETAEENGDREAFFRIRDDFRRLRREMHAIQKQATIIPKPTVSKPKVPKNDDNDSGDDSATEEQNDIFHIPGETARETQTEEYDAKKEPQLNLEDISLVDTPEIQLERKSEIQTKTATNASDNSVAGTVHEETKKEQGAFRQASLFDTPEESQKSETPQTNMPQVIRRRGDMLRIRVPLVTPTEEPKLATQRVGTYAYNEFQYQKKEQYIQDIFDLKGATKKWLKTNRALSLSPVYNTLQDLRDQSMRKIVKQDIPALLTLRKTFVQVAEGLPELQAEFERIVGNTNAYIPQLEHKINRQEGSWITKIKKRMLPVYISPQDLERDAEKGLLVPNIQQAKKTPVTIQENVGESKESTQKTPVKNVISGVRAKVNGIFSGIKNFFAPKKTEKQTSLRAQFFPKTQEPTLDF